MSISERLQMVIKMNGMNNASFADEIGVQRSSISHVLAGRNKPSIDFIQKILKTFPKVNADWLITGKKIGKVIEKEGVELAQSTGGNVQEQTVVPALKEEDQEVYGKNITSKEILGKGTVKNNQPKITKILVFYDDGTFEETLPRHQ